MYFVHVLAALLLALIPPPAASATAGPTATASPSPRPEPKTIVTVVSSPYCNALAQHFNGALLPMLANDRVFNAVSVQLDDLNNVFKYPDYQNRFIDLRLRMVKETTTLSESLAPMRDEIGKLRDAAALSTDPKAAAEMRDAADALQGAYTHQMQLSVDLSGMARAMMEYRLTGPHPLNGWTWQENAMPAAEKDVKDYLRFDRQRTAIDNAEDHATDVAETIAETRCSR
jgi:hypothetical protein